MSVDPSLLDDDEPTRFRDYQVGLLPPWLRDPVGTAWARSFGLMKDTVAAGVVAAVQARIISMCPDDALPLHGRDSGGIEQFPNEPIESYRTRLLARWETWAICCSDLAFDWIYPLLGWANFHLVRNRDWDWDGHPGRVAYYWDRMWPVIDTPNAATLGHVLGSTFVLGSSRLGVEGLTDDQVAQTTRQTLKWTDSGTEIPAILLKIGPHADLLGDSWLLGTSTLGPSDSDVARLQGG